jgi:hypothetical protein
MKMHIDRFYQYLEDLCVNYENMADLLVDKIGAVEAGDLGLLGELMNQEQAYVLKSRGFDQNLTTYKKQIGFKGDTLAVIIRELPEDQQGRFALVYERLKSATDNAKTLNDKCQQITGLRLREAQRRVKELETATSAPVQKDGKPPTRKIPPGPGSLSKSI